MTRIGLRLPPFALAEAVALQQLTFMAKRWTPHILYVLQHPAHYNQLVRCIPGIPKCTLTERLRELERIGLVKRYVHVGPPQMSIYELTAEGLALRVALESLYAWAFDRTAAGRG
jgi:DNA-binding HxlR family transcriptional regulator